MKATLCGICLLASSISFGRAAPTAAGAQQPEVGSPRETYLVRVEDALYGRIEISLDRGGHWILVGRVLHPTAEAAMEKAASRPGTVLREGAEGLAFCTGPGRVIRLLPDVAPVRVRRGKAAPGIGTDVARGQGIFGLLAPPAGAAVGVISDAARETRISADYTPALDDIFVFHVRLPRPAGIGQSDAQREDALEERVRVEATDLQKSYAAGAVARARKYGRRIVSGLVMLRATLPPGEPDPITAVTYVVDGRFVAAQDTGPFLYRWNTLNTEDGEHVIEIRGVNRDARPITEIRALVVVRNRPDPPSTSAVSTPPSPHSLP